MKTWSFSIVLALFTIMRAEGGQAQETGADPDSSLAERVHQLERRIQALEDASHPRDRSGIIRAYWRGGLHFDTADATAKFRIGGRIMNDWAFLAQDDPLEASPIGNLQDGTEMRRARLYVSGVLHGRVEFKAMYDFAGGNVAFNDVYVGVRKVPALGTIRVGHQKEPFGLEEMGTSKYFVFMERALTDAFTLGRNSGIVFKNRHLQERLTWSIGGFRDTDRSGNGSGGNEYGVTARVTGLPWYRDGGRRLLHLGAAYTYRNPDKGRIRYRQRPEAHLAPLFVDTKSFAVDHVSQVGVEEALVYGPASLRSEFMYAAPDRPRGDDPGFFGVYVSGSYFLTGEHRAYKKADGIFDRVRLKRKFGDGGPGGAWQIGVRFSHLDLNDAGITGGRLDNVTVALNWYLNANARIMWNYVHTELNGVGDADIGQTRFQVTF